MSPWASGDSLSPSILNLRGGAATLATGFSTDTLQGQSGLTVDVISDLSVQNTVAAQRIELGGAPSTTSGLLSLRANSAQTDYLFLQDATGAKSNFLLGLRTGDSSASLVDGLNLYDASHNTMLVRFSSDSVRFYPPIVAPVFDSGGALSSTYNAALFLRGSSKESQIQAAITAAVADGIARVYVPASMYPYSAASISFSTAVQMVREGGDWSAYDVRAYGARGNGTGDDTAAIQQAIYGGVQRTVRIPSGAYPISSTITIPPYSHIVGDGRRIIGQFNISTVIYRFFNGTAFFSGATVEAARANAIVLEKFTLDSQDTAGGYSGTGFDCRIASGIVFSDVEVIGNIGTALYLSDTFDSVFDRFWVRRSGATNPAAPAILIDGITSHTDRIDFYSSHCENNYWTSCQINQGATGGRPKWVTFISPKFHDWQVVALTPGTPLLSVASAQNLKILGGQFSVFSSSGLSFAGDQCNIIGTQFTINNGARGLDITGGSTSRFDGITFVTDDGSTPASWFTVGSGAAGHFVRYSGAGSVTSDFYNAGTNMVIVKDQTGLETQYFGNVELRDGNVGIGGTRSSSRGLFVQSSNLSTTNQVGIASRPVFSAAGTGTDVALDILAATANSAFTAQDMIGILVNAGSRGAASSIQTCTGLFIVSQSAGSNNFGIITGTGTNRFGDVVGIPAGSATTPGLYFSSQSSLGWQRNGTDLLALSRGELILPDNAATQPSFGFSSENSLGLWRSGVSTIGVSYGSFNLNQTRLVSIRTQGSLDSTTLAQGELAISIAVASGASLALRSGNTIYYWTSSASTKG